MVIMDQVTHLVKLHTDSDPFHAKAVWDKDQRGVEVLLLQKDKAWKIVLKSNDMGAVAKKLQVGVPRVLLFCFTLYVQMLKSCHPLRWRRAKRQDGCVRPS